MLTTFALVLALALPCWAQVRETSGMQVMVRRMTASIVAIDRGASSISFEGPNGWKYSRRVVDPTVFDQVKVGDKVDIMWNTDLTVSVE